MLAKEDTTKEVFDKMSEELGQILQTVGAALYQQEQQAGAAGPQAEGAAAPEADATTPKEEDGKKDAEEGEIVE